MTKKPSRKLGGDAGKTHPDTCRPLPKYTHIPILWELARFLKATKNPRQTYSDLIYRIMRQEIADQYGAYILSQKTYILTKNEPSAKTEDP